MSFAQAVSNHHVHDRSQERKNRDRPREVNAENSFHWEFQQEALIEEGNVYFLPISGLANNKDIGQELRSQILSEIDNLSSLEDCWDGPRSKKPSADAMKVARTFVRSLPKSISDPEVCPARDGEISISWRTETKFFEVSIYDSLRTSIYARSNGKKVRSDESVSEFSQLPLRAQLILRQI